MTTLREAAQQALEALEDRNDPQGMKALPAMTALRAALAEPVEPVAWLVMDESGYVQHAASWRDAAHEHINDAINEHDLVCARTWRVVPAYASPPQRKPLTDEEIERLWYPSAVMAEPGKRRVAFGRAIEQAHGIGSKA
jgi:hypothetical protein